MKLVVKPLLKGANDIGTFSENKTKQQKRTKIKP